MRNDEPLDTLGEFAEVRVERVRRKIVELTARREASNLTSELKDQLRKSEKCQGTSKPAPICMGPAFCV